MWTWSGGCSKPEGPGTKQEGVPLMRTRREQEALERTLSDSLCAGTLAADPRCNISTMFCFYGVFCFLFVSVIFPSSPKYRRNHHKANAETSDSSH